MVNDLNGNSVLVIEDEESIRLTMKVALESEGYKVFTAENGKEGLEVLKEIPQPCLIFLDLMMPIMNGWDFVDELEKKKSHSKIPIVVVTAFTNNVPVIKFTEFLRKPIDFKTLFTVTKKYCSRKE